MNRSVSFLLQGCLFLFLATQAFALQNAEKWSGFYAGADIGNVLSSLKMHTSVAQDRSESISYFNYTQDAPQLDALYNSLIGHFSGGVFGGYQKQFNHIIVGGEASLNSLNEHYSETATGSFLSNPSVQFITRQRFKSSNWQETFRLKLGLTQDRWLFYFTGGVAMTSIEYTSLYSDDNTQPGTNNPGASGIVQKSKAKCGWALGAGGEYALTNAWFLHIKYLYANFGTIKTRYIIIPTPTLMEFSNAMNSTASLNTQSLLGGLTYRF